MKEKDIDQIIAELQNKVELLEGTVETYHQMLKVLITANRMAYIKCDDVENRCAEIFFSRFYKQYDPFGFIKEN